MAIMATTARAMTAVHTSVGAHPVLASQTTPSMARTANIVATRDGRTVREPMSVSSPNAAEIATPNSAMAMIRDGMRNHARPGRAR
jgi:hypothetical protein